MTLLTLVEQGLGLCLLGTACPLVSHLAEEPFPLTIVRLLGILAVRVVNLLAFGGRTHRRGRRGCRLCPLSLGLRMFSASFPRVGRQSQRARIPVGPSATDLDVTEGAATRPQDRSFSDRSGSCPEGLSRSPFYIYGEHPDSR